METYVFSFGKYRGKHIKEVLDSDASYLLWCHDNVEWFHMLYDDLKLVEKTARKQRKDNRKKSSSSSRTDDMSNAEREVHYQAMYERDRQYDDWLFEHDYRKWLTRYP